MLQRLLPEPSSIVDGSAEAAIGSVALAALAAKRLPAKAAAAKAAAADAAAAANRAPAAAAANRAPAAAPTALPQARTASPPRRRHSTDSAEPARRGDAGEIDGDAGQMNEGAGEMQARRRHSTEPARARCLASARALQRTPSLSALPSGTARKAIPAGLPPSVPAAAVAGYPPAISPPRAPPPPPPLAARGSAGAELARQATTCLQG